MKLSELKTGEKAVVVKVSGHGSFRRRIAEMGFIKGNDVKVTMNAPLKDPIEYEIIGYKLSLRRKEAAQIEVISETEAKEVLSDEKKSVQSIVPERCIDAEQLEERMKALAETRRKNIRVALVGNPNCGKTSLFNVASGAHEHVGNYGGVTVDIKEGHFDYGGYHFTLVDLPGTYSLSTLSPEELYVRKSLVEDIPDVVINVVDSTNLERNLYLTTQLIDMDVRTVMALNMYDEFVAKGDKLDIEQLRHLLGLPVMPTNSKGGKGVTELFDTVIKVYERNDPQLSRHIHINHGAELELSIDRLNGLIRENEEISYKYSTRYLAIKYLEKDKEIEAGVEGLSNRDEIITTRFEETERVEKLLGMPIVDAIVEAKYAFIQGALEETYRPHSKQSKQKTVTNKIDAVVTNKWAAFPIFFVILFCVFEVTFAVGQYPMDWIDWIVEKCGEFIGGLMPAGWWLTDLIVDGVIGGVGAVLVFLPNILILYLFISLLEDSGYMARAAFIMDRLMHKMGLHGKSFIPMIMGFGCNVPAIMATRSIESRKSRFVTILVIPFMACAGRLPVFVLIAGAFFPRYAGIVMFCLYLLGIVLAVLSAKVISHFVKDDDLPFVMELPPYRVPTGKSVLRHTWEKGKQYIYKMATTILVCSMIIWALGYFPHHEDYTPSRQMESSCIGAIGKVVEPVMRPIGFDWKMSAGVLAGIGAKEVVISTLGVIYSAIGDDGEVLTVEEGGDEDIVLLQEEMEANDELEEATPDANTALQRALLKNVTPASALSYMVFILLYFPCIATFVAVKNESGSWKWAILDAIYGILVAWLMSFIVYHIALLF
ncbi:MAG: ferrous iron transport protein B [Bacteroidales bacterium]|nr:ferrous iron transport protein B [Bacteroidales bacterium]